MRMPFFFFLFFPIVGRMRKLTKFQEGTLQLLHATRNWADWQIDPATGKIKTGKKPTESKMAFMTVLKGKFNVGQGLMKSGIECRAELQLLHCASHAEFCRLINFLHSCLLSFNIHYFVFS